MSELLDKFREVVAKVVKSNPKGRPIDKEGRFYPNPVPIAPPVGYNRQPSLADQIRDMVRSERLAEEVRKAGYETFEEGDDFDVDDDFDPRSPFEYDFDPPSERGSGVAEGGQAVDAATKGPVADGDGKGAVLESLDKSPALAKADETKGAS